MKQQQATIAISTHGSGFTDVTDKVRRFVHGSGVASGLLTLFLPHTSASLLIQENADPDVLHDLAAAFARLAPRDGSYRHMTEGPDDMPAHIRAALTQTSLSVPVIEHAPALGAWQAIYLFEHRDAPHRRDLVLHVIGE